MAEFTIDQINKRIAADPDMQELHKVDPTEFDVQVTNMYDSFGYNPDGKPLNVATKIAKKVEGVTGIPRDTLKGAAAMGISMATTGAGMSIGSAAGPVGTAGGAMVGSLVGERAGSALGLIDEPASDALALGAPLLGPAVGKVIGGIGKSMRSVPGVGTALHQQAGENLEQALTKVKVTPKDVDVFSKLLDTQIKTQPFRMKTPMLLDAVKQELDVATSSKLPDMPYIEKLNALIADFGTGNTTSFKSLMATEGRFNDLKESAPNAIWKKLSGVLISDMDAQANNPALSQATRDKIAGGAAAYKNLIKVNRKLHASTALDSLTKTAITEVNGDPNMVRFNKTAFVKKLNYDQAFDTTTIGSTFSSSEITAIREAVDEVGYLGWGPSGAAQSAGQYIGRSGAAGAIGYTIGGGSKGAMTGFMAAAILSHALESDTGRRVVKHLAKKGKGSLNALELQSTLGRVLASTSAGVVPGVTGAGSEPVPGVNAFANQE